MRIIEHAISREIKLQLLSLVVLLFIGIALLVVQFEQNAILTLLGLGAATISLGLIIRNLPYLNVRNHPIHQTLCQQAKEVVWVYSIKTHRMPFGLETVKNGILYFHFQDGTHLSISIPAHQLKLVSKYLNRLLPHASFGYSKEREQTFHYNPQLLSRKK